MELRLVRKINNGWNSDLEIMKGQTWDSFPCVFLEHTFMLEAQLVLQKRKGAEKQNNVK